MITRLKDNSKAASRADNGPQRREADAPRRRAIIEAVIAVIARHSLSSTTIERVALEARVSPGTVMFHFDRKEALLVATMEHVAEEFEAVRAAALSAAGDDPAQALAALIEVTFDPKVSDPKRIAVWYAFWGEAWARQAYLDRVGSLDAAYQADLTRLCRDLAQRINVPRRIDAEVVALGLSGLMNGLWEEMLTAGRQFDRARAKRLSRTYLETIFPGLFGPNVIDIKQETTL
jgi:TetR/AcrR family transcriptional repressor of bet genes